MIVGIRDLTLRLPTSHHMIVSPMALSSVHTSPTAMPTCRTVLVSSPPVRRDTGRAQHLRVVP